ncbi:hypothetical protein XU18_0662 [Perkinsela sp. CCAP 1560/4]|nr:hypothetical protein XU18_0662 [Perkinsela sp. CCAP 1560/4]|eukprot:KNH08984.1 hypothetical protein XU18_0662 [Perkinsela sp. CCAP 1560/4]
MRKKNSFDINAINEASAASLLDHSFQTLIGSGNDPRARLEVIRLLSSHLVYFLVSRQKNHDPLLVYPQAFLFQKKIANNSGSNGGFEHVVSEKKPDTGKTSSTFDLGIPVFTALPYLQEFANKNEFSVFGPDGEDWVNAGLNAKPQLLPVSNAPIHGTVCDEEPNTWKSADDLYQRAWPVNAFEVPSSNTFTGCFGEFSQIIEHFSIFPPAVQLIINPSTPIEWSMPLAMGQRIGRCEEIGAKIYHEIADKVSSELHVFFSLYCPEVNESYYWVCPRKTQSSYEYSSHSFVIAIGIASECFSSTYSKLLDARRSGAWRGHPSVVLKEICTISSSWEKAASKFYARAPVLSKNCGAYTTFTTIKTWDPASL